MIQRAPRQPSAHQKAAGEARGQPQVCDSPRTVVGMVESADPPEGSDAETEGDPSVHTQRSETLPVQRELLVAGGPQSVDCIAGIRIADPLGYDPGTAAMKEQQSGQGVAIPDIEELLNHEVHRTVAA